MSFIVIDRRKNDKGKSTDNRNRFVRRVKAQVKEAMKEAILHGTVKGLTDDGSKKIRIAGKGLNKPFLGHDNSGGFRHIVVPGNEDYVAGDRIRRPESGKGQGESGDPSKEGADSDNFSFELTQDEFLDMFFQDLELPNLSKRNFSVTEEFVSKRAGFAPDGNKLNITRTMGKARGRRVALRSKKKKRLEELEKQYNNLLQAPVLSSYQQQKLKKLKREIEELKRKIKKVPFIDTTDELYNRWESVPVPTTKAVMFCLMDVSGSMQQHEKELAKRFFMLLYFFLQQKYQRVDIRFIRHTQIAKEVDEQEFFYSRETGGTIVSSGIEMIDEIIKAEYPKGEWNVYISQASDGDNWPDDSKKCSEILQSTILPKTQYYAYLQTMNSGHFRRNPKSTELWKSFADLKTKVDNFDMVFVNKSAEIFPVFQKLFKKRGDK